ncbi:hypothetical protein BC832DRAFT_108620 [Gaertneriomyces semiglobifer]|nr:hypothetical protein BC832DRAFT_108620 [Gaertneriomyces semiglobifer]
MADRTIADILRQMPPLQLIAPLKTLSSTKTTTPAYPRTDLRDLRQWSQFPHIVNTTKTSFETRLPALPIRFRSDPRPELVDGEAAVEANFITFILRAVEDIAAAFYNGPQFSRIAGNREIVADPDFIYVSVPSTKAKIVGEVKTPWAFDVVDILQEWTLNGNDVKSKVFRAISQLYGYMTFNQLRYGILTTYNSTWVFRRSSSAQGGVLEVSERFTPVSQNGRPLLEALFTVITLAEENWFYASPTHSPAPSPPAVRRALESVDPHRLQTEFPYSLVRFRRSKDRSRAGAIVEGDFRGTNAIMKTVDISKHETLTAELDNEVSVYRSLAGLQGAILVRVLAYAEIWNMLRMLVLEPFGLPVSAIDVASAKDGCIQALHALHQAGYSHGDIKLANFVIHQGQVRIIDFGFATPLQSPDQAQTEMQELRVLLEGSQ